MGNIDRFKDALWVTDDSVIIGGQGGIGSWLSLLLSRIGYSIYIYDDDIFDQTNMGGQFVTSSKIGVKKVTAVKDLITDFGGNGVIHTYDQKYTLLSPAHNYMIAAFDNMEARKDMFNRWFEYNSTNHNSNALFIDGRLTLEQMQIFCVTPKNTKHYRENYLFDDSEVDDVACTLKQTSHSAAMIASFMTGFFTNHITNVVNSNKARVVPYTFEYFIPLNMFSDGII